MNKLEKDVIRKYELTGTLKGTSRLCFVSTQKVRKILLTNGIMPDSDITHEVVRLREAGLSINDIANKLNVSHKAVHAHLPYDKGMYLADNPSINALRIRKHRE